MTTKPSIIMTTQPKPAVPLAPARLAPDHLAAMRRDRRRHTLGATAGFGRALSYRTAPVIAAALLAAIPAASAFAQNGGSSMGVGVVDDEPIVLHKFTRPALPFGGEPDKAFIVAQQGYEKQIRRIRAQYLGHKRFEPGRQRGLEELSAFTAPPAILPLIEVLRDEGDDVRTWLLDHLADAVDPEYGRPTLAWLSIYEEDEAYREAARTRLEREQPGQRTEIGTSWIIARALQSPDHKVANHAGLAAGQVGLVEAIPLLITAQAAAGGAAFGNNPEGTGALAWIQFGTSRYFVSDLTPVVGTSSAGFDPELSVLREGTVVAIDDAIVTTYRSYVHDTLVQLVEEDFGERVDFGYDVDRWKQWYGEVYLPRKRQEARDARLREQAPQDGQPQASPPPTSGDGRDPGAPSGGTGGAGSEGGSGGGGSTSGAGGADGG